MYEHNCNLSVVYNFAAKMGDAIMKRNESDCKPVSDTIIVNINSESLIKSDSHAQG